MPICKINFCSRVLRLFFFPFSFCFFVVPSFYSTSACAFALLSLRVFYKFLFTGASFLKLSCKNPLEKCNSFIQSQTFL